MTDSDFSIELLDVQCPAVTRSLTTLSPQLSRLVRVQDLTTSLSKVVQFQARTPAGGHSLLINYSGSLWLRTPTAPHSVFVPSNSITFMRSAAKVVGTASKGDHRVTIVSWSALLSSVLENWITGKAGSRLTPLRILATQAIAPRHNEAVLRFQESLRPGNEDCDPFFLGSIFDLCGALLNTQDQVRLTAESYPQPEPLRELILAVREEPTAPWPLPEAATRAGYSPFHFSRVFKSSVGCGFHEYVERCRTELAIEMLISTTNPVELVANSSGFGTPQSLRDAMRTFTGFAPSDLRASSDAQRRTAAK